MKKLKVGRATKMNGIFQRAGFQEGTGRIVNDDGKSLVIKGTDAKTKRTNVHFEVTK